MTSTLYRFRVMKRLWKVARWLGAMHIHTLYIPNGCYTLFDERLMVTCVPSSCQLVSSDNVITLECFWLIQMNLLPSACESLPAGNLLAQNKNRVIPEIILPIKNNCPEENHFGHICNVSSAAANRSWVSRKSNVYFPHTMLRKFSEAESLLGDFSRNSPKYSKTGSVFQLNFPGISSVKLSNLQNEWTCLTSSAHN